MTRQKNTRQPLVPVEVRVNLKCYSIIADAVSRGVGFGVQRAFKHDEAPPADTIGEHVEREVMNALAEVIDFGDGT